MTVRNEQSIAGSQIVGKMSEKKGIMFPKTFRVMM